MRRSVPVLTAIVVAGLGGCADEPTSAPSQSSPAEVETTRAEGAEEGAWEGGHFTATLAESLDSSGPEGRVSVLVRGLTPPVPDATEARIFFELDDAKCRSGEPATEADFELGSEVDFFSPPNPAGLDAMYPPPLAAEMVRLEC